MNLVDVLFNAAGGGVFGSLLHLGTSFFDTWKKKKEAETEIMLLRAKSELAEKAAAWDAFARSQPGSQAPFTVPANAAPWASTLFVVVEAFKTFTRPGLTWALLGVTVYVFAVTSPEAREAMKNEITFGAFTAVFWYFGSRYTQRVK